MREWNYLQFTQFTGPVTPLLAVDAEDDGTEDGLLRRRFRINLQQKIKNHETISNSTKKNLRGLRVVYEFSGADGTAASSGHPLEAAQRRGRRKQQRRRTARRRERRTRSAFSPQHHGDSRSIFLDFSRFFSICLDLSRFVSI